ncbi:hypothetical protein A1O1_03241 [Capronia coronata CBS 617.96]|uniref:Uncharacterized protein n=1 Tax=Capronia coronata CBS 617.96 TaxID=1182541 RepID=W9YQQ1_9EURO|nr:uncharacterized protein A1O1_03241 [Capronia coronata CBS 617.96]EXJ94843.1 hypothetical protein A1O1_03241 [Capronia coronata CBS 617.96]
MQRKLTARTRKAERKADQERARKRKAEKKMRKAARKRSLSYYGGGLAWGFDPNAGMLHSGRDHAIAADGASQPVSNAGSGLDASDLKPVRGHTWGIHYGKTGMHVQVHDQDFHGSRECSGKVGT